MLKVLKRWWKYLTARTDQAFKEKADPKVQLEQAITEAQDQHRRLMEQAANVIAQQKQTEMRLNRQMSELERVNGNARQALMMAQDATTKGEADKAAEYNRAAESFAGRLVTLEKEIEDLKAMALQATQAADQAKAAVATNGQLLQQKLSERQKLLGQLEQAKMQETMNKAMASLSETVGQDVPTFAEVRDKIEARYAKAKGMSELSGSTVESRMLEVEQAAMNTEAQTRLSQMRAELGLAPAAGQQASPLGQAASGGELGQSAPAAAGGQATPASAETVPAEPAATPQPQPATGESAPS